jgi:NAD+ dependent glucose-6-phosphate dehydrogenase
LKPTPIPPAKLRISDLTDFEAVQRAAQGMDVVVHMAADPSGAEGWESILNNNIVGSYHLFEACRLAGVRRVFVCIEQPGGLWLL